jgi:hypothetical protein
VSWHWGTHQRDAIQPLWRWKARGGTNLTLPSLRSTPPNFCCFFLLEPLASASIALSPKNHN